MTKHIEIISELINKFNVKGYYCLYNDNKRTSDIFDIVCFNKSEIKIIKLYIFESIQDLNNKISNVNMIQIDVPSSMTKEIWCYIKQFKQFKSFAIKGG